MPFHPDLGSIHILDLGRDADADRLVQHAIARLSSPDLAVWNPCVWVRFALQECDFATYRTHDLCLWAEVVGLLHIDTHRDADTASEQSSQKSSKTMRNRQ